MVNLNDSTPLPHRLSERELDAILGQMRRGQWPQRRAYIPRGCDQQGRRPEAGHAATEIGADLDRDIDSLAAAEGVIRAVIWSLAVWALIATAWVALS